MLILQLILRIIFDKDLLLHLNIPKKLNTIIIILFYLRLFNKS